MGRYAHLCELSLGRAVGTASGSGRWYLFETNVTFSEPGQYVLWGVLMTAVCSTTSTLR
jgi:hypothetical protein